MRTELDLTLYKPDGTPAAGASCNIVQRGTSTAVGTYTAATGGASSTAALTADADGRVPGWIDPAELTTAVDARYTIDGTVYTWPIDFPSAVLPAWTAPGALLNGWVNYGAPFGSAGYAMTSEGFVILRGLLKTGTIGASAFQLPTAYRPPQQYRFPVATSTGVGRVEVQADGNVVPANGSNTWISLDGCFYRVS